MTTPICRNTQQSLLPSTNTNFGEDSQVLCVYKKNEKEEVEKKLPNEYESLFIPKRLWPFNKHIFIQYTIFRPIVIFFFSFNKYIIGQYEHFQSIGTFSFNKYF